MPNQQTAFKKGVERIKLKLRRNNSSYAQWAKENGHTVSQVYAVTRRTTEPQWGLSRDIALKLEIIKGEQHA